MIKKQIEIFIEWHFKQENNILEKTKQQVIYVPHKYY